MTALHKLKRAAKNVGGALNSSHKPTLKQVRLHESHQCYSRALMCVRLNEGLDLCFNFVHFP